MNLEEIIRAWKTNEETVEPHLPPSPVGEELSEEELLEIGGGGCRVTCGFWTCFNTCAVTI
jgi:hypothetical protein